MHVTAFAVSGASHRSAATTTTAQSAAPDARLLHPQICDPLAIEENKASHTAIIHVANALQIQPKEA
jgi:PhoPQ-activated pathogenicity-related protein